MDLYSTILGMAVENEKIEISFHDTKITPDELVELQCCSALCRIKEIIESTSKANPEYFYQIEKIIRVLEALGIR